VRLVLDRLRLGFGRARGAAAVQVLRLREHDVRAVAEEDGAQVDGRVRRVDPAAEAAPDEHRQLAGVVDVRVGLDDGGDARGVEREGRVSSCALLAPPLVETAVEQDRVGTVADPVARAGRRARRAEEPQLHRSIRYGAGIRCRDSLSQAHQRGAAERFGSTASL
jgi:hypothetical protein